MTTRRKTRWVVLGLLAVGILGIAAIETMAQSEGVNPDTWGYLFGFGQYPDPGGTLHTVFQMQPGPGAPIRTYTTDIVPEGDQFLMTETIDAPTLQLSEITSGLGGGKGVAAVAGGRYEYKETAQINLSPLGALAEHGVVVEANQTYYLPDGASFATGEIELIAGIEVIKGTFTHPEYPTQQAVIGTALDAEISKLLQFPVYIRIERDGVVQSLTQLIEFDYQPKEA